MKSVVRPELPTASVGSSQAPTAAVDNSAPLLITAESTYKSGKSVQTTGATSLSTFPESTKFSGTLSRAVATRASPKNGRRWTCSTGDSRTWNAYSYATSVTTIVLPNPSSGPTTPLTSHLITQTSNIGRIPRIFYPYMRGFLAAERPSR